MKQWLWRISATLAALALLIALAGVLVLRSDWFRQQLRQRVIATMQQATGARVELGSVEFDWRAMRAQADRLVLHGKETAEEAPLLHVDRVTLGLHILSALKREVDLQSLRIEGLQAHIIVYPDGSTNFPDAGARSKNSWAEELLNLKVQEYEVVRGVLDYDGRNTPLNIRGENLEMRMTYDAPTQAYRGKLSSEGVKVTPPGFDALESKVAAEFTLERERMRFTRVTWASPGMTAEASGVLEDVRQPHGTLNVKATARMRELVREFRLPVDPAGQAAFNGTLDISFAEGFTYAAKGRITGQGLQFVRDKMKIANIDLRADAEASATGAALRNLTAHGFGSTLTGDLTLKEWRELSLKGQIADLDLRRTLALYTPKQAPWNGTLSGPFETSVTLGKTDLLMHATLAIAPASQGDSIEGHVEATYDQAVGTVALGTSSIATSATRLEVEGTLGRSLRVRARTTRLEDLQPVLAMAQDDASGELPLHLNNGSVSVDGTVTGSLEEPVFHGQVAVVNGQVREYKFDQFTAELDANEREVTARNISATRGRTTAAGTVALTKRAGANGAFSNSEMTGQLSLRNVSLAEWAPQAGYTQPIAGTAGATVRFSGSLEQPEADIALDVQNPMVAGETLDRLRVNLRYLPGALEVSEGVASDGGSEVRFAGSYKHPLTDWRSGALTFDASTPGLPSARIERTAKLDPKVGGTISGRVQGTANLRAGKFSLVSATADIGARQIFVDGQRIGDVSVQAQTRDSDLSITARGNLRESQVEASGAWKIGGDSAGRAEIRFSRISIASLQDLVMLDRKAPPPAVEGFIEGSATVNIALEKPREFRAEVRLTTVQVNPKENPAPRLGLKPEEIVLRNSQPVVLDVSADSATVRAARFTGRNTQMDVAGTVPFNARAGVDLTVRGDIDLVILQLLRSDLQASGNATVNASIRGSLQDPNVIGQLSFAGASLYLPDLPNNVDNATGTISFDRRRATIQQLTTETGGGQIRVKGFLEFGDTLLYRLQAEARRVRVRYPQDVSTTFNADLSLNGTSESSTLSGVVTLTRSAFLANADFGQLLAETSQSNPAPDGDEYLKGMQLDVRIQNSSDFQMETSLASNVEADVDLRLRGTPSRPVLLGSVAINRGELQFAGNRYTVDRGDIRFLNPVKIEPTLDMDLSTRARGVTVNVSFSGTLQHLNPSYSSDPPLQPSEIIALLAVGRDPTTTMSQSAPGVYGNSSGFQAGGSLLGQVAGAQVSNKVQRFFGATRVKIDPTLTGVDNLPQARLTFEQQVSKDITLTYIANLSRTQEQIVRVQWDLSREWSAIAVRDQNGLFGIDFQFRKRFK